MPHIHTRKVVRRRRIVRGHGIRDDIVAMGRNGLQYLKHTAVNGLKGLVPIATTFLGNQARKGLNLASDYAADKATSLMHSMGDRLQDKITEKTGGSARPGRSMLLREINHALAKTSISHRKRH